jgi:hypothetical protein
LTLLINERFAKQSPRGTEFASGIPKDFINQKIIMKKLLFLLMLAFSVSVATQAQDDKDKVKKTSTVPQKVHNTFSKHKHYKGYKAKHKGEGRTLKHKVDVKNGEAKTKTE